MNPGRIRKGRAKRYDEWCADDIEWIIEKHGFKAPLNKKQSKKIEGTLGRVWGEKCRAELARVEKKYSQVLECESMSEKGLL